MPKLRVHNIAMSIDGYAAGPDQSVDNPLGVRGRELHDWGFETRTGRAMIGERGGATGVDDVFVARGDVGIDCAEIAGSRAVAHVRFARAGG